MNLDQKSNGSLSSDLSEYVLNNIGLECTVTDDKHNIIYYSIVEEPIFTRTPDIIGTPVIECHPEQTWDSVNLLLADLKNGKRKSAEEWRDIDGRKILIRYIAMHDPAKNFVGILETVQDISKIQNLISEGKDY